MEITIRDYPIRELQEILHTSDKQSTDRKLQRYGIQYTSTGRGECRVYSITYISDPFKIYAIDQLGINPQADFTKIRNLYYYLLNCEGFAELPYVEMERRLEADGKAISRGTISRWIRHLERINFIMLSTSEANYYAVIKMNCRNYYKEIPGSIYREGWKLYFQKVDEGADYRTAYRAMKKLVGGHPIRVPKIIYNAVYTKELEELQEKLAASYFQSDN